MLNKNYHEKHRTRSPGSSCPDCQERYARTLAVHRAYQKKTRERLDDVYLRDILFRKNKEIYNSQADVPEQIVSLYKVILQIKRIAFKNKLLIQQAKSYEWQKHIEQKYPW